MSTTVHIPERLLERVDARARARGVSRNRVILEAIEASLGANAEWPPELVRMLEQPIDDETGELLERTLAETRQRRIDRRRPPKL
jgi:predicted transcriptional regulator